MAFALAAACFGGALALIHAFAPLLFPWAIGLIVAGLVFGKADAK